MPSLWAMPHVLSSSLAPGEQMIWKKCYPLSLLIYFQLNFNGGQLLRSSVYLSLSVAHVELNRGTMVKFLPPPPDHAQHAESSFPSKNGLRFKSLHMWEAFLSVCTPHVVYTSVAHCSFSNSSLTAWAVCVQAAAKRTARMTQLAPFSRHCEKAFDFSLEELMCVNPH